MMKIDLSDSDDLMAEATTEPSHMNRFSGDEEDSDDVVEIL